MRTSETPLLKEAPSKNGRGEPLQLCLFLRAAILNVGALGAQFSKEYNRLLAIENRLGNSTFQPGVLASHVRQSVEKEILDILNCVLFQIELSVLSLQTPLDSLRSRLHSLEKELQVAEQERAVAKIALGEDLRATLQVLEGEAESLRQSSRRHLIEVVEHHLSSSDYPGNMEDVIQGALAEAITTYFNKALKDISRRLNLHVSRVLSSHQDDADRWPEHMLQTAARLFNIPYAAAADPTDLTMKRKPYWVLRNWIPVFPRIVPRNWIDRLLPSKLRKKRLTKRLFRQVEVLVSHNVENLRWALYQNIKNAFQRFASRMDERFLQVIVATRGTIEAACYIRHDCSKAIADRVERLISCETELEGLCVAIQSWASEHCPEWQTTSRTDLQSNNETGLRSNMDEFYKFKGSLHQ